jgi:hypothetical protein
MTNRRDFLHGTALATGSLLIGAPLRAAAKQRLNLQAAVIEADSFQGQHFAAQLAALDGTPALEVPGGDITSLWLQRVGPTWRRHPAALAGLTTAPTLFCLEQLALMSGLRVVFHAEHIVQADSTVEHEVLRGAAAARLTAQDLQHSGTAWPARAADAVAAHRARNPQKRHGPSAAALAPPLLPGAALLTSWIIAPV